MSPFITVIVAIVTLVLGLLIGYIYRKNVAEGTIGSAEQKARNLILDAEKESETIKRTITLEAEKSAHEMRSDVEKEIRERRNEIQRQERRLYQKEESVDRKLENIEKKEERITQHEKEIVRKKDELDKMLDRQIAELEKVAKLSVDEAKALLLEEVEKDCRHEASQMIRDIEAKAREEADRNAKEIITGAIQRCAADHVAETTLSVVNLPNDDMKGRIIGREGRNIRAIETLTGVDLIIDDTPEAVIVSGFDPVRREVARLALEKLIVDGRIHPAKIEEMVEKAQKEVSQTIRAEGEQATFEAGIHNLHPEIMKLETVDQHYASNSWGITDSRVYYSFTGEPIKADPQDMLFHWAYGPYYLKTNVESKIQNDGGTWNKCTLEKGTAVCVIGYDSTTKELILSDVNLDESENKTYRFSYDANDNSVNGISVYDVFDTIQVAG